MLEWANVVMVVSELGERHAHSVNQVYGDNDVIKNRFLKLTWHTQALGIPGGFTKWQEKKCFTSKWRNQRNGHTKYTKEWTSLIITSMSHKTETDAGWDSHHF